MAEGDEQAFHEVITLFNKRLSYMVIKLVGDSDEAKDIVSEIFMKLWDRRTNFQSLPAIKAFLYISARNKAFNFLREKKKEDASKSSFEYWFSHPEEVPALILNAELAVLLEKEIQSLPSRCREIVQLAYYKGFTSQQIAEYMGISIQTVHNQKTTALRKLRTAFLKKKISGASLVGLMSMLQFLKN